MAGTEAIKQAMALAVVETAKAIFFGNKKEDKRQILIQSKFVY